MVFDQKIQREHAKPGINQMLTQQEKWSKWDTQLSSSFYAGSKGLYLSLGLSFGITLKKIPLIEYIAVTEKASLKEIGDPDSISRTQGIRNLVLGGARKGYDMQI